MPAGVDPVVQEAETEPAAAMGFFDHLVELRRRLIYCLVAISICCVAGFTFWQEIYAFIAVPIEGAFEQLGLENRLVFTGPLVPIKFALQVGLYAGIFLSAPVIFWQLWLFVAPGLYRHEQRFVLPFVLSSSVLFVLGSYFAHRVVLPITLTFLLGFGRAFFDPLITINEFFSLWLTMVLWMGLIFQLPILVFILSWIGLVTPGFLVHYLRHAIVAIAAVAALITPTTDVFTLAVFALPMVALYLLSIGISYVVRWRREAHGVRRAGSKN